MPFSPLTNTTHGLQPVGRDVAALEAASKLPSPSTREKIFANALSSGVPRMDWSLVAAASVVAQSLCDWWHDSR